MKTSFLRYEKIDIGLLYDQTLEVDYPDSLHRMSDPIQDVKEDSSGRLRVETDKFVYIQSGYLELR